MCSQRDADVDEDDHIANERPHEDCYTSEHPVEYLVESFFGSTPSGNASETKEAECVCVESKEY